MLQGLKTIAGLAFVAALIAVYWAVIAHQNPVAIIILDLWLTLVLCAWIVNLVCLADPDKDESYSPPRNSFYAQKWSRTVTFVFDAVPIIALGCVGHPHLATCAMFSAFIKWQIARIQWKAGKRSMTA